MNINEDALKEKIFELKEEIKYLKNQITYLQEELSSVEDKMYWETAQYEKRIEHLEQQLGDALNR